MTTEPATLAELFRSLELTLTVRAAADEDEAWACTLSRPDGRSFEIESVSFFDVDPDTGDEWIVEPGPTRVLGVLAGGDVETEDEAGEGAAGDAEAAARAFLGDEAYELLLRLDEEELGRDN
ncbi:MAG: hypothetical protein A2V85_15425 [Chloroflexi bacterium RBG_16_72_14]|nr:MAG: hypothetical protein A2V85_15425 [Chloroflexi bacterium RBG_16_72_14]